MKLDSRVMTRRDFFTTQTDGEFIKRRKFETAVASDTRNGCLAIQVAVDERLHDVALEFLFQVQNIERKSELFGDAPRVINIIERTAARRQRLAVFIHT